jgi:hypothetical protein
MRRIVPLILATAALLSAMAAPALATHGTTITYTGPVKAGSELILSCPDGFTLGTGEADFYRDPKMRVPVALNVSPTRYIYSPTGDRTVSAVWAVPKGARYADAFAACFATISVSLTAQCLFDDSLGQWVWQLDYSITNASSGGTDRHGTVYYRIDGGERQGGTQVTVPAEGTVSGSFQLAPDNTAERFVVVEYDEVTTGFVFDSNSVVLVSCP